MVWSAPEGLARPGCGRTRGRRGALGIVLLAGVLLAPIATSACSSADDSASARRVARRAVKGSSTSVSPTTGSAAAAPSTGAPSTGVPSTGVPSTVPGGSTTAWRPGSATPLTLHWMLGDALDLTNPVAMGLRDRSGAVLPAPDVYDIDGQMNSAATVAALHALGRKVICYFDAGVFESYRPDAARFPRSLIGHADAGWNDSFWLDIRKVDVLRPIMEARIADCAAKGFDSVEPDEVDGYSNDSGFPLTYQDQITYNRAIASWVHAAGLSVGQKGDLDQTADLVGDFDWTLNEECGRYDECATGGGGLQQYSAAGKAVWIAEYRAQDLDCAQASSRHWNSALYVLGLPATGARQPCRGW